MKICKMDKILYVNITFTHISGHCVKQNHFINGVHLTNFLKKLKEETTTCHDTKIKVDVYRTCEQTDGIIIPSDFVFSKLIKV